MPGWEQIHQPDGAIHFVVRFFLTEHIIMITLSTFSRIWWSAFNALSTDGFPLPLYSHSVCILLIHSNMLICAQCCRTKFFRRCSVCFSGFFLSADGDNLGTGKVTNWCVFRFLGLWLDEIDNWCYFVFLTTVSVYLEAFYEPSLGFFFLTKAAEALDEPNLDTKMFYTKSQLNFTTGEPPLINPHPPPTHYRLFQLLPFCADASGTTAKQVFLIFTRVVSCSCP